MKGRVTPSFFNINPLEISMSSTEIIFNDKLSLELFREGKRPVDKASEAIGLLFINTKPTGSTKLAIRPATGKFEIGDQTHQNPTASVNERTNYLLFCNNIHVPPTEPNYDPSITTTNRAIVEGNYLLQKDGVVSTREHNVNSLLNTIEADPNLVILYDHDTINGVSVQHLYFASSIVGATNTYYIELDGVHINSRGESLIDALLNYEETSQLIIAAQTQVNKAELLTSNSVSINNRDSKRHRLYIRYIGSDTEVRMNHNKLKPIINSSSEVGMQVDPDGLGVELTFAPLHTAYPVILPWHQYSVGGDAIVGNRYVIEVNGVAYRDNRSTDNLLSPTASLDAVVSSNPLLAAKLRVESGGEYNKFENLTNEFLDVKIYLDEVAPYYQNNKEVDTGNNPAGIYKKLRYPYGSEISSGDLRKTYTYFESVKVTVTAAGLSFRLGPKQIEG